ncbi:MAG: rhomboid family intramembrane serine protease [bacterium]|nr:rhomboid family intramembrane serine protease [bacterium]
MDILLILFFELLFLLLLGGLITPFPISDTGTVRYNSLPWMTITLILINTLVFMAWQFPHLVELMSVTDETQLTNGQVDAIYGYVNQIWTYGLRRVFFTEGLSIGAFSNFTAMFMHADFSHLAGNMIFLWAFGRRLEDACGHWRFLLFYLLAGTVSHMGSIFLIPSDQDVPSIGASGAISGVMGAYLLLFPGAKMTCLWVLIAVLRFFASFVMRLIGEKSEARWTIKLPALLVVGLYIVYDIQDTFNTAQTGEFLGGVNYIAHTTGFLAAITIFLFVRKDLLVRYAAGRSI